MQGSDRRKEGKREIKKKKGEEKNESGQKRGKEGEMGVSGFVSGRGLREEKGGKEARQRMTER